MFGAAKSIFLLSSKKQKIAIVFLIFAMLLSAALELVGISAILPIIDMIENPVQVISNNGIMGFLFYNVFHLTGAAGDYSYFLSVFIILVIVLYIFKAAFLILLTGLNARFAMSYSANIATRLLDMYMRMPYEYHVSINSAEIIKNCTYDVDCFVSAVQALLTLASDIVITFAIVVYLFVIDWRVAGIVFGVLAIFASLTLVFLKKKAKKYGVEATRYKANAQQMIQQSLGGIKETKISNSEEYYKKQYYDIRTKIAINQCKWSIFSSLPRIAVECIGMIAMLIAILVVFLLENKIANGQASIVAIFSTFAVAVVKLLPYTSKITNNIGVMSYNKVSTDIIYHDLKEGSKHQNVEIPEKSPYTFMSGLRFENVSFSYKGSKKLVIRNANLLVQKGSSVAFTGASGAGKTTFVDILLGLLTPNSGRILCDGIDIRQSPFWWHKIVSYIPQTIYLNDDTIRHNIAYGIEERDIDDDMIEKALKDSQLYDFVQALPNGVNTVIGEAGVRLSGGQRQRIGIARAFYRNTEVVIFDEATSALDYSTEGAILDTIECLHGKKTLIIITHRLNTIEKCDHIYEVRDGNVLLKK